jgi:hypothetical protein
VPEHAFSIAHGLAQGSRAVGCHAQIYRRNARTVTPTRSVQRLSPAVERVERSAMAGLSRGRSALPPFRIEGIAFDTGGGYSWFAPRLDVDGRLGRASVMTQHAHHTSGCVGSRVRRALASPCVEGSCLRHKAGGGRNATGLARRSQRSPRPPTGEPSPMAFLGGGVLSRARRATPTRCDQRLGSAVAHAAKSEMADPSRGRIALPPRHDEGTAFVAGGGNPRIAWRLKTSRRLGGASALTQHTFPSQPASRVGSALRSAEPPRATDGSAAAP